MGKAFGCFLTQLSGLYYLTILTEMSVIGIAFQRKYIIR